MIWITDILQWLIVGALWWRGYMISFTRGSSTRRLKTRASREKIEMYPAKIAAKKAGFNPTSKAPFIPKMQLVIAKMRPVKGIWLSGGSWPEKSSSTPGLEYWGTMERKKELLISWKGVFEVKFELPASMVSADSLWGLRWLSGTKRLIFLEKLISMHDKMLLDRRKTKCSKEFGSIAFDHVFGPWAIPDASQMHQSVCW